MKASSWRGATTPAHPQATLKLSLARHSEQKPPDEEELLSNMGREENAGSGRRSITLIDPKSPRSNR
jgi:hypothetical protein